MSRTTPSRFLLLLLALCLVSSVTAQSKRGYVRLTRIGPLVEVKNNKTQTIDRSYNTQPVEEVKILDNNTVITTGDGSRVILVFSNGATLNIKENSELNIQAFKQDPFAGNYDPATATKEPESISRTEIFLRKGELVGNVKSLRAGSTFNVATPAGAAGIRGTTFRVVFRPSGTGQAFFSVTTLEGDVGVTTSEGTVDAPISVVDSEEVSIIVEVDDTTGEVTVVTPIEEIAPTTADPQVLAEMTEAVQQSAEAVVDVVLNSENDQSDEEAAEEGGEDGEGDEEAEEESEEESEEEAEEESTEEESTDEESTDEESSEDDGTTEGEGESESDQSGDSTEEGDQSGESTEGDSGDSGDNSGGDTGDTGDAGDSGTPTTDTGTGDTGTGDTGTGDGNANPTPTPPTTEPPPVVQQPDNPTSTQGSGGNG